MCKKIVSVHYKRTPYMRMTKTQSRTPPTRPYPLHKKIKILFLGGTFIMSPIVPAFYLLCNYSYQGQDS